MGAYLSEPKTEKISNDQVGKNVAYGASSMQGWRVSQEDAHNCCIDFDENMSLFAVYDGHGGHEVAAYCADNLPDFIKNTEAYKNGDIKQALIDAFLGFDATLDDPEIVKILKKIACSKDNDDESDEEENVSNLYKEASMPLAEVIAKYQLGITNFSDKNAKSESSGGPTCSASPYMRSRRAKDKAVAGCSTSSWAASEWNSNETDVSSSSQQCESSSSTSKEDKVTECVGSSEDEQVLDSTTSNGDIAHVPEEPVDSSADVKPAKNVDMPDSSGDVDGDCTSSPAKSECSPSKVENVKTNGTNCEAKPSDADSSKAAVDSVSSSSSAPLENGEVPSTAGSTCKRKSLMSFYQSLLYKNEDDDDDEDEDDDDESYENYGSSDDDDDAEDPDDEEEGEDKNKDYYEDLDDDDDDEEEGNDRSLASMLRIEEQPGSVSGCTAVVAVLKGNELYVANAGDSRCVLCRNGTALELSLDHKPEDELEMDRIVKAGGRVTADGRVNGGLNLSRALGDHSYKKNTELPPQDQMISALPDIRHVSIDREQDDFMILACDGIWNFMSSQDVVDFVHARLQKGYDNLSKICEELFDHCLAPNTLGDGTGCDNMTAVIIKFRDQKEEKIASASTEQPPVGKKRRLSDDGTEEKTDCPTQGNDLDECKRLKTDTV